MNCHQEPPIIDKVFLQKLRKDLDLDLQDFAQTIGCGFSTLQTWLYSGTTPSPIYTTILLKMRSNFDNPKIVKTGKDPFHGPNTTK